MVNLDNSLRHSLGCGGQGAKQASTSTLRTARAGPHWTSNQALLQPLALELQMREVLLTLLPLPLLPLHLLLLFLAGLDTVGLHRS